MKKQYVADIRIRLGFTHTLAADVTTNRRQIWEENLFFVMSKQKWGRTLHKKEGAYLLAVVHDFLKLSPAIPIFGTSCSSPRLFHGEIWECNKKQREDSESKQGHQYIHTRINGPNGSETTHPRQNLPILVS